MKKNYLKFAVITLMCAVNISNYAQNCKKFVDYQTKDINKGAARRKYL